MANKTQHKCLIETLNFGSFPGEIMFSVGFTYEQIVAELKKQRCNQWLEAFTHTEYLFTPNCAGHSSYQVVDEKKGIFHYSFIHIKNFDWSDDAHSILAHEIIHCCTHSLSDRFDIVKENEAFAYTHTHVMKQCYAALRKKCK